LSFNITWLLLDWSELVGSSNASVLSVGRGVLAEPDFDGLEITLTLKVVTFLVVTGVELKSGVATDLEAIDLVSSRIELGDDQVRVISNGVTEFFPDGGKSLAVTAPWGVVLNKNVLGGVLDNLLPGGANNDSDWALSLGLGLRLKVGLKGTRFEVVDPVLDAVDGDSWEVTTVDELLHVLARAEETESRGGSSVNTDELSKTGLDTVFGTGDNEEDLSVHDLGSFGEDLEEGSRSVVGEEDHGSLTLTEDGFDRVLRELDNDGDRGDFTPVGDSVDGVLTRVVDGGGVKVTEDAYWVMLGTVGGSAGTGSVEEWVLLVALGNGVEGLEELTSKVTEVDKVELSTNLTDEIVTGDFEGSRAGLLVDPLDNGISGTATGVVLRLSVAAAEMLDREILIDTSVLLQNYNWILTRTRGGWGNP
jgi:hypothetical protein